jgi:5'-methylthioadenosine phosphorylase
MHKDPLIGVIGGSGLYQLFDEGNERTIDVDTPYGAPSSAIRVASIGGRSVAFLPRHGAGHTVPPHAINYRANVWALASLGVKAIVSTAAVGGLTADFSPGCFALPDQFIDRTWGRRDTFFDGDGTGVQHLAAAEPYCPVLRDGAIAALLGIGEDVRPRATAVVIQGPRFSTRAESAWFRQAGAHIVNMTQYPEVALAAELNVGLVNLSFVTDTDAGSVADDASADDQADAQRVLDQMAAAQPRLRAAIAAIVGSIPHDYTPRELIEPRAVDAVLAPAVAGAR